MRLTALLALAAFPLAAQAPVRTCESLRDFSRPYTTIASAAVDAGVCRIEAIVAHPPAEGRIRVWVALPMTGWNGRFQGLGGGGFSGGSAAAPARPASQSYAAASTDTGHEGGSGSFALDAAGRLNWAAIRDNAHVGIHEMTVTAKALVETFYGKPPRYSYFNGCSTGGRQGLMEAQRYPADYNGIFSGAPAINWPKLHIAQMWGHVVMNEAGRSLDACKLTVATASAISACDLMDGVRDGVIEDPSRCKYDPLILTHFPLANCPPITAADADVIRKIWEGPRRVDGSVLWPGLPRSAALPALNARVHPIPLDWWRYFLKQDPKWEWTKVTRAEFEQMWDQSTEQFGAVIGTDNPDLAAFSGHGGKLIVWHGWSDQVISAFGTIDYYTRVKQRMGAATPEFLRFFLAPGVAHCGGGEGAPPVAGFEALVKWVEEGQAPDTLTAGKALDGGAKRTRPLCQYPLVARYIGKGSTDDAANFTCAADF